MIFAKKTQKIIDNMELVQYIELCKGKFYLTINIKRGADIVCSNDSELITRGKALQLQGQMQ